MWLAKHVTWFKRKGLKPQAPTLQSLPKDKARM